MHRDLAARNVLLGSDLKAKVSDYGFSRHMAIKAETESCYYKLSTARSLPIRWTVRVHGAVRWCFGFGDAL